VAVAEQVPQRLAGQVCIVTGAGQGLGRGFAQRLALEGADVIVADLNPQTSAAVAADIGERATALEVDVSQERSAEAMAEAVLRQHGRIDVLINNASLFSTLLMRPFDEIPVDEWDRVMAVNLRGVFLCSRAVLPAMRAQGRGKIVNISSATVWIGRPNYLHYVTSKAGVIGLTRAMASEVGQHGITVNAVTPGATLTEVPRATVTDDQSAAIVAGQALKRRQRTDDLLGTIGFLASSDSDFITGQTLNVDGGAAFH